MHWTVFNQTQRPAFQRLLEELAKDFGPCTLVTGTPHRQQEASKLFLSRAPAYDRRSLPRRAVSWSRFTIAAARHVYKNPNVGFLLAVTNPPSMPNLAWLLRRTRGLRYGLVIWDIYPEHIVHLGWLGETSPVTRAWQHANKLALLEADVIVTLGSRMAEALRKEMGSAAKGKHIHVIPNWSETDLIRPLNKASNPFAFRHGQQDKITFMYAGNVGATHGLDPLLDAAAVFRSDSKISFLVVGDGHGLPALRSRAHRVGLTNVRFLDRVSWDDLPNMLATADVALVSQARESAHLSVPSKTYNALAAGAAILAVTPAGSDLHSLVAEYGVGLQCEPGDSVALARAVRRFTSDADELDGFKRRARETAERHFSAAVAHSRFREVLAPILQQRLSPSGPFGRLGNSQ